MTASLSGRVAIVTGAGKGLGRAYALELARRGAAVVVNNRAHDGQTKTQTSAFETAELIRTSGGRAVENYDAVEADGAGVSMVKSAVDAFGALDIVVANAAAPQAAGFSKISLSDFRYIFDVSFLGTAQLLHAAWPQMRERGYGRIVTTTSSAGRYGQHGLSAYGAAKGAIESLTRTLAAEGKRHNILVNAVSPYAASQMTASHMREDVAALFQPDKVAPLVAWLASESCTANGEIIVAGGGRFRRAFAVETKSADAERGFADTLKQLHAAAGVAHPESNTAFDTLLVEAGLAPRKPLAS